MKWIILVFIFTSQLTFAKSEPTDSLPYTSYRNHFVYFNDFGFSAAPFTIKNNFKGGQKKLQFDHNWKPVLGVGMAWRWISFRVGIGLPFNLRSKEKYGDANFFHLGLKFNVKRFHINIDYDNYRGYVLTNEKDWNNTPTSSFIEKNNLRCQHFTIAGWYFFNESFNMNAFLGRKSRYHSEGKSWYIRPQIGVFTASNKGQVIAPNVLTDTTIERTLVNTITVFELGVVPGYGYVNNFNNWQVGVFGGLGLVMQGKNYKTPNTSRSFAGFEPRADLRFISGYTKEKFFILLDAKFDFKTTRFQDLVFEQTYYTLRLVGGFRVKTKTKEEKRRAKNRT